MVRGRFCVKRCGPSRHRLRDISAALENFARHPKKTFSTLSAKADLKQPMFDVRFSLDSGHCQGDGYISLLPYPNIWAFPLDALPAALFWSGTVTSHGPSYSPRIHITNERASSTETLARRAARL